MFEMSGINGNSGVSAVNYEKTKPDGKNGEPVKNNDGAAYSSDYVCIKSESSMRTERPFTVSGGIGYPNGLHLGIDYNFTEKFSAGASAGTTVAMNEYELHGRFYPVGGQNISLYTETGAGLIQSNKNMFNKHPDFNYGIALSQSIGVEYRADNGLTINGSIGKALVVNGELGCPTVGKITVGYSF
jgi:hypothetical protein